MISVVLVNWNGWSDTISCIQSLLNSTTVPSRIIVVDNMSTDHSLDAFALWAAAGLELLRPSGAIENFAICGAMKPRTVKFGYYLEEKKSFNGFDDREVYSPETGPCVYFVKSGRNGGFGFGCNVGMRLADILGSSSYWLLNNDCVVDPAALRLVSKGIHKRPNAICGTIVRYYHRPEVIQAFGGGKLSRLTGKNTMLPEVRLCRPLDYIYGASMVFSSQLRAVVGDFDEKIFMYFEEIDFSLRAAKAGFVCDVIEANVYHKHGGSQESGSSNAWMHVLVNKYYVLNKHFGWGVWTFVFCISLILRCVVPFGAKNSTVGARRALNALIINRLPQ